MVLGIALVVLVGAGGLYGLVLPAHSQFRAARHRLAMSEQALEGTRRLATVRAADRLREANLFTPEEAAVFPAELARMANAAGVRLDSVTAHEAREVQPEGQPPMPAAEPGAPTFTLHMQRVQVRIAGSYDGIRRFISALEERRPTLLLDAVGIKLKGTDPGTLAADLTGGLHILQSSRPTPVPPTIAAAPEPGAGASPFGAVAAADTLPSGEETEPGPGTEPGPSPPEPEGPSVELPSHLPPPEVYEPGLEGPEPSEPEEVQPPPEPVIVLVGTVADARGGLAVFTVDGRRATYKAGEYITPTARLVRVDRHRATIGLIKEKGRPGERLLVPVGTRVTGLLPSPPPRAEEEPLPEVVSVIAGRGGSLAVLAEGGRSFQVRVGDSIPGGTYTVERIDSEGVVVTDGKTDRRLPIRKPGTARAGGAESPAIEPAQSGG